MIDTTLSTAHQRTYQRLLEHPAPHNLQWRDVMSLVDAMEDTDVTEDANGTIKVTRHGHTVVLHRPRGKDLADPQELLDIRHFLELSEAPARAAMKAGTHLLVVMDHREARIFSAELHGAIPKRITPYDPFGHGRDLHYNQGELSGHVKPERKSFYEAIARTLQGAQQIVLFGTGTGTSSAMEHLLGELRQHHADIAARVVASAAVDEHHQSDDQLLAKARELFAMAVVGR